MSDLIDRQAVLALAKDICVPVKDGSEYRHRCIDPLDVMEIPSAEPERKKGEWLPHTGDEDWDVCSVCGTGCKRRERGEDYGNPWVTEYNYPFCPHCGTEMTR